MKKTLLIIFIVLIIAIFIFLYLGEGREDSLSLNLKDVPKTPINEICLEISHPDNINYCLAVVNQDISFCEKSKMLAERNLCKAMALRDVSYCREIQDLEPKQVCYYELSFLKEKFDYCEEMGDPIQCYFAFVYRMHWESRADEIKAEYCDKINDKTPRGLILKDCCLAFKEQDSSLCQGNKYCLSFFEQPLSFCDTDFSVPGGGMISKNECLLHRALSEKDPLICERIESGEPRDMCYADMSTHIYHDLSFCDKIKNGMIRDMCYAEQAIYLSEQ